MEAPDNHHWLKESFSNGSGKLSNVENHKKPLPAKSEEFSGGHSVFSLSHSMTRIVTMRITTHRITTCGRADKGGKRNG
jgi:hypothetical protein